MKIIINTSSMVPIYEQIIDQIKTMIRKQELMMEEQKKEVEQDLEQAILKGRRFGISDEDIKTLFELILEG